jgi:hypothetical protein
MLIGACLHKDGVCLYKHCRLSERVPVTRFGHTSDRTCDRPSMRPPAAPQGKQNPAPVHFPFRGRPLGAFGGEAVAKGAGLMSRR